MSKGIVDPDAWASLVGKVGLGGAVLLIFALGIAFNLHKIIRAIDGLFKTILKHKREKNKVPAKVRQKQTNLKSTIDAAKRNGKKQGRKNDHQ